MSEFPQSGQHPDADQLSAFTEDALPAHERQQTLAHLSECAHCRTIVSLSLPPIEEIPPAQPIATSKPWFYGWNLAWPISAAVAALIVFTVHLHKAAPVYAPTQMADAKPPTPPTIPEPRHEPSTKALPQVTPKSKPAKMPSAIAPSVAAISNSQDDALIENKSVADLPIQGRNITPLAQQKLFPNNTQNGLRGSSAGAAASAAPVQNFNQAQSAIAGAAQTVDVTSANPSAMELETVNVGITPQTFHKVPSGLAIASTITRANQTLALDTAGALFLSTDSGHHWKTVPTQWQGKAVTVELSVLTLRSRRASAPKSRDSDSNTSSTATVGLAPNPTPTLTGVVTDASGAIIPDASVIVTGSPIAAARTVKTDSNGHYAVDGLVLGSYQIAAISPGFEMRRTTVMLVASQPNVVNLSLAVGQQNQAVTVENQPATLFGDSENGMRKTAKISSASVPLPPFEITTDKGERWISADGQTWTRN